MTGDRVEVLRRALEDAEREAREATRDGTVGVWSTGGDPWQTHAVFDDAREIVVYDEGSPSEAQAIHIAAWDPSRVLRLVERDRRILERHEPTPAGICQCLDDFPCADVRDLAVFWLGEEPRT